MGPLPRVMTTIWTVMMKIMNRDPEKDMMVRRFCSFKIWIYLVSAPLHDLFDPLPFHIATISFVITLADRRIRSWAYYHCS